MIDTRTDSRDLKGEPEFTNVVADGLGEDQLLALAAAVERESEHPLAQAVARRADETGVTRLVARSFRNVPGHGAQAEVDVNECSWATAG